MFKIIALDCEMFLKPTPIDSYIKFATSNHECLGSLLDTPTFDILKILGFIHS